MPSADDAGALTAIFASFSDEWEAGLVREVAEDRAMLWYGHEIRLYRRAAGGTR